MKIYLVGGAVRDELLNLPVKERDFVVVGSSIDEMMAKNYTPVGKFFPVFLHPDTKEEYALARIERKVQGGYHGFTFDTNNTVTLEQDLSRRDLTINAMAKDEKGHIIDPYGGQKDLKEKKLRHVSEAFIEDPVRVLRVARFAARFAPLGFTVAPETIALMKKMGQSGELDFLVPERVCKELITALKEPMPVAFIQVLRECDALKHILPEINALYGVPQDEKHHPEKDTGIHMEMVLNQATRLSLDPHVRFAAMLHDVGKGQTPQEEWPNHPHHEQRGEEIAIQLCERLRVANEYQALARLVVRYHGDVHRALVSTPEEILTLLEKVDAFRRPARFTQFLLACEADFKGRPGYETKEYKQATRLRLMFAAVQDIDVASIVSHYQGQGEEIKNAIHAARLKAISVFKV